MNLEDSGAIFHLAHAGHESDHEGEIALSMLQKSWSGYQARHENSEQDWIDGLRSYLKSLAEDRIDLVKRWLAVNTARFSADSTFFDPLHREFESLVVALQSNVQVCGLQCAECALLCLCSRHHEGGHTCQTDHRCVHQCHYEDEHEEPTLCGLP